MSHLLHRYIARQLLEHVTRSRVVVWYDPRAEFEAFVDELPLIAVAQGVAEATVDGVTVTLTLGDGSLYAVRSRVEPLVSADEPPAVVVYLPGAHRDPGGSALMELEMAGTRWEPQLRHLARHAMRQRYTEGVIDGLLDRETVNYGDIVAAIESDGTEPPSMLKPLLQGTTPDAQIASWLADPELDEVIVEREGAPELASLIAVRLGKAMVGQDLAKWRSVTARHVLVNEFLSDLADGVPGRLAHLKATSDDTERNSRIVARALRGSHPHVYAEVADRAQQELGIDKTFVGPLSLGSIDTFRFEEVALLERCAELVAAGAFAQVGEIARVRRDSSWLNRSIERQAQWQAITLAAVLGAALDEVEADLLGPSASPEDWVEKYEASWYRVDRAQRHFEGWLARLDDDPDIRAVVTVRERYDAVIAKMAEGFVAALDRTDWTIGSLAQTSIYDDVVRPLPGRVAYFLVDAMRFEMGRELAERLEEHGEWCNERPSEHHANWNGRPHAWRFCRLPRDRGQRATRCKDRGNDVA
jgi:hypothetical protein